MILKPLPMEYMNIENHGKLKACICVEFLLALLFVTIATIMAPSSVDHPFVCPLTRVSQKPLDESSPNFVGSYLSSLRMVCLISAFKCL